jgi:hypothetical protein
MTLDGLDIVHCKNNSLIYIGRLGRVCTYIQHVYRYNRSRDGPGGGKYSRNRRYATTGPPQTLRRQAQRLSGLGGLALRSGRPDTDDDDEVVGGVVGGRLKVTCRGCPRCLGGGVRTGGACATGRPLRSGLAGSVFAGVRAAFRRSVDTLSILSPISRRKKCVDCSSTR